MNTRLLTLFGLPRRNVTGNFRAPAKRDGRSYRQGRAPDLDQRRPGHGHPGTAESVGREVQSRPGLDVCDREKQEMDKLLKPLGAAVSKREDHTPALIIGNDSKGVWTRTYGLAKISQIIGVINDVMAGKVDESVTTSEVK